MGDVPNGTFDESSGIFKGELYYFVIYDFNAADRPWLDELQVTIARETLPGQEFEVSGTFNIKIDSNDPYKILIYDKDWNYLRTVDTQDGYENTSYDAEIEEPNTDEQSETSNEF